MRGSGKQRRTVGDPEREVLLPVLQNTVIGLLRNDTRLTATQEWKMQVDFHLKDALRWPNRGTLAEYIEQHFGSRTCSGTILEPWSTTQVDDEEAESPLKIIVKET